jgi:hypothetical protein
MICTYMIHNMHHKYVLYVYTYVYSSMYVHTMTILLWYVGRRYRPECMCIQYTYHIIHTVHVCIHNFLTSLYKFNAKFILYIYILYHTYLYLYCSILYTMNQYNMPFTESILCEALVKKKKSFYWQYIALFLYMCMYIYHTCL